MHALGNDFLLLDAFAEPGIASRPDLHDLARALCDRHRGVGADGLIVISAPAAAKAGAEMRMRTLNADGGEGGVSGNGARCAAKFAVERGLVAPRDGESLLIDCGPRRLRVAVERDMGGRVARATVDMGRPEFDLPRIPVDAALLREVAAPDEGRPGLYKVDHRTACFVSMGNPHMVVFTDEPADLVSLADEGPKFERHPAFPQRINFHVVNIASRGEVAMRSWERGAGETLSCASGACAAVAAGIALGHLDRSVRVRAAGGVLEVRWDRGAGGVLLTGEAVEVFSGEWNA